MNTLAKPLLIDVFKTICRIAGQMLIPGGASLLLEPSIFAQNRILPNEFYVKISAQQSIVFYPCNLYVLFYV